MWIRRKDFIDLIQERAGYTGRCSALEQQVVTQKVSLDWFMVRLTQLEHERAALIQRYMGVTIAVPSIEAAPVPGTASQLPDSVSFEDMGDDAAKAAGIEWDDSGRIQYTK